MNGAAGSTMRREGSFDDSGQRTEDRGQMVEDRGRILDSGCSMLEPRLRPSLRVEGKQGIFFIFQSTFGVWVTAICWVRCALIAPQGRTKRSKRCNG
jgi:hypothetical protein